MFQVALLLHLASLLLAFFATGLLYAGLSRLRRAGTVSEARAACAQMSPASKMHPASIVGLLLTGAYMTQTRWTWGTPWIDASILALVLIGIFGGGILGGRERSLDRALEEAGDGAITPAMRNRLNDPLLLAGSTAIPVFVLATMYVMISKPAPAACSAILVAGAAIGAILGMMTLPSRQPQPAASEA